MQQVKGVKVYRLSDMIPGMIYMYAEVDPAYERNYNINSFTDDSGNILYTFVFIHAEVLGDEIVYECDLIEAPEGDSRFKMYDSLDQHSIEIGTSILYKLTEV